jgi:hypothetical protein
MPGNPTVFGPSISSISPSPGSHFGGAPAPVTTQADDLDPEGEEEIVAWARQAAGILKRERQDITLEMTEAVNLSRGGTPFFKNRPPWKIGTRLNKCFTVPDKWAAVLTDSEPTITFGSTRPSGQRTADLLTAAYAKAHEDNGWQRIIRNTVFSSRVQKKAFLSLRPDPFSKNKNAALLLSIPGLQVWVDRNATSIDDAEVIMYEYRQSFGKVVARFPDIEEKLLRKYENEYDPQDIDNGSVLSPPATLAMPTGAVVNNPPYSGSPNPPDEAGGTSGLLIREFWTRPHRTVKVKTPMLTASGEPATVPKRITYADGTSEPMRRIITEGNVVYELPQSLVDGLQDLSDIGGVRILDEQDAYEVCFHKVDSLLYPDGRLLIVVDDFVKPKKGDMLNPLGYIPFIEIEAHPDPMRFYGISDIDLIKDAYEALVRTVSLIFNTANLAGNAVWRIPDTSNLANDDITNAPASIQREDMTTLRYGKREAAPEMPNYIMNLVQFYLNQIDDLSGLTQAAQGKSPPKAQQSTDTALMMQEQSGVSFRDGQRSLKRAMTRLGQHFQEFVERFYTEPELVEIKNALGEKQSFPLLGSHIGENYRVEAKPGSMMSATPTARLNTVLNLLQSGFPIFDLPEVWKLLAEVGAIESATALEKRITEERADPKRQWLVPGAQPQPKKGSPKKPNSKSSKAPQTQGAG